MVTRDDRKPIPGEAGDWRYPMVILMKQSPNFK
jgi:hypothetical protein